MEEIKQTTDISFFEKIFDSIDESTGLEKGTTFKAFSSFMSLPDEEFNRLKPTFLNEFEKSLQNPNDQLALAQALNVSGVKIDELILGFKELGDQINEQLTPQIGENKAAFLLQLIGILVNAISTTNGVAKRIIQIPIQLCHPDAKIPEYAHTSDSGMDVFSVEDVVINPGETKLVHTGIKVAIPEGYELQVRPKSGISLKSKMRIANAPGTIDAGYRDEVCIIVENIDEYLKSAITNDDGLMYSPLYGSSYTIEKGQKFAQLVLAEVPKASFFEVPDISNIGEDRMGGFGSTGLK